MKIRLRTEYFKTYDCEKEAKDFVGMVLKDMGLNDWIVNWEGKGTDSICIRKAKTLYLGSAWLYGLRVLDSKIHVLHEIAHINTEEDCWHGDLFQAEHLRLIKKYLIIEEKT